MDNLHAPVYLENPAKPGVAVFIHGFMGSPRQFDFLTASVYDKGLSVASLLLPGHGGTAKDFSLGTFERWQSHVDSEIERLALDYADIWLAGHSMGGLLAINAAVKHCSHVRGVFTIASPFKMSFFSIFALKVRLRQVFGKKSDPIKAAYLSACSVPPSPSLVWRTSKPSAELKKLIKAARDNLQNLRVPVTAVYSASDELVSIASLDIFKSGLVGVEYEQVLLSDSLHAWYPEHERNIIENAFLKFIY